MKTFRVEITPEELENLLFGENPITQYDRFRIQSFTTSTLISQIGSDFSPEQLEQVYRIEEENLKFLFRTFYSVYFKQEIVDYISSKSFMMDIYASLKKECKNETELEASYFNACIMALLSHYDQSFEIKLRGKIPFKMFSFRQMEANKWYNSHCKFVLAVARQVYIKLGRFDSLIYVAANCAYYLNKSQPYRYCINPGESMNDTLYRLWHQNNFEDSESYMKEFSMKDIPFSKDL